MSKGANVQPKQGGGQGATPRNRETSREEFLSYEQIWQMTDGQSAETDASLLHKVKTQYEAAQKKAKDIVLAAQAEAGRIEQEAYQKGFEQGKAAGQSAGRQQFEKVVQRFAVLFEACNTHSFRIEQTYQERILELIKAMADRLAGLEVATNHQVIRASLKNALSLVGDNLKVRIRLNPADYRNLIESGLPVPGIAAGDTRVQLVEDGEISAGGCLLSTDYGEVDATWETRRQLLFDAVEQAFAAALLDTDDTRPAPAGPPEAVEEADPWL